MNYFFIEYFHYHIEVVNIISFSMLTRVMEKLFVSVVMWYQWLITSSVAGTTCPNQQKLCAKIPTLELSN